MLIEAHDEWQVADRRYLSEGSMAQLTPPAPTPIQLPSPDMDTKLMEVMDDPAELTA